MPFTSDKMDRKRKVPVKDLNPMLTCSLCEGYLIDATVLADCLHVFCRGCIIKYFDNCRTACPNCNILYKKKNQVCFRPDPQIQSLVYKLVPNLYSREMQTREDFYRSTGVRANSSCSDDSVIDKERDNLKDQEAWITSNIGDKAEFFSPEDMISLSIEYYQAHLDTTSLEDKKDKVKLGNLENGTPCVQKVEVNNSNAKTENSETSEQSKIISENKSVEQKDSENSCDIKTGDEKNGCDKDDGKRFLKCPAAVSMQLLQKFLRMKFGLTHDHRVDIIYNGEVLPNYLTLMDVAYTFKWSRTKPLRFFYRIFTPMKIKPIKIINTTSTTGSKQLQIVQVDESTKVEKIDEPLEPKSEPPQIPKQEPPKLTEDTEDQSYHKERLMAHLQLQSTHKKNHNKTPEKETEKEKDKDKEKDKEKEKEKEKEVEKEPACVFEYVEPDKEEIKRFAEKRDREWALQKKLDEKNNEHNDHYFSKKRKKSKHSKNESIHKKRKLHAEITSNEEEDLKLKVKITNSHKHKHHKNSQNHSDRNHELSTKEKLLQMRQVRHKHVSSEDKTVQTIPPTTNINNTKQSIIDKITEKSKQNREREHEKKKDVEAKAVRFVETGTTSVKTNEKSDTTRNTNQTQVVIPKDVKKPILVNLTKDMNSAVKEWSNNNRSIPTVKIDKLTDEKQKTFLKSFQSYTEKARLNLSNLQQAARPMTPLEKKISSIQQQCTIEPKKTNTPPPHIPKTEKVNDTTQKLINQYPPGFTVSKIEAGVKRKAENDGKIPDKRPSLEITLIPPKSRNPNVANRTSNDKVPQKRPPPPTIPLVKIKKSINLKTGISIIPKSADVCDNIGALDLSNKSPDSTSKPAVSKSVNGMNMVLPTRNIGTVGQKPSSTSDKPTHQLSNLQMLSKVASEHPILNKLQIQTQNVTKSPRPNMPNLQTLNSTSGQNSTTSISSSGTTTNTTIKPNLPKLPKLTEISKTQFKISGGTHIRTPRPNQNQNIRNIPNPSLLVRQQNQNRLNSISANVEKDSLSVVPTTVNSKVNNIVEKTEIPV